MARERERERGGGEGEEKEGGREKIDEWRGNNGARQRRGRRKI